MQQCMGDPPLHAGGFCGKRGSVSASQRITSLAMEGQFSLTCSRFLPSTHVEGEEHRAACCQRSNTEAIDCSLGFWFFFPILKNYRNAGHFSGRFARRKSIFAGSQDAVTQRRLQRQCPRA